MGTSFRSLPNAVNPIVCTAKRSRKWGITPMQGPRWVAAAAVAEVAPASDFGGAGFFAAGLAGEGLGAGVGASWARAGCATASTSNRARLRITTGSSYRPETESPRQTGPGGAYALEPKPASCIREITPAK